MMPANRTTLSGFRFRQTPSRHARLRDTTLEKITEYRIGSVTIMSLLQKLWSVDEEIGA